MDIAVVQVGSLRAVLKGFAQKARNWCIHRSGFSCVVIKCFIEAAADFKVSGQASEFRRKVMKLRRQVGGCVECGCDVYRAAAASSHLARRFFGAGDTFVGLNSLKMALTVEHHCDEPMFFSRFRDT